MFALRFGVSLALVLLLSTWAQAGLHYGQVGPTVVLGGLITSTPTATLPTIGGPPDSTTAPPANNSHGRRFSNPGASAILQITWTLALHSGVGPTGPNFYVYTYGVSSGAPVTQIVYTDGLGRTATKNGSYAFTSGTTAPNQIPILGGFQDTSTYTVTPGFNFTDIRTMRVQFTMANGSNLRLDTVAINPEPGAIALFGLGALGLAGLVRARRRRAPRA